MPPQSRKTTISSGPGESFAFFIVVWSNRAFLAPLSSHSLLPREDTQRSFWDEKKELRSLRRKLNLTDESVVGAYESIVGAGLCTYEAVALVFL